MFSFSAGGRFVHLLKGELCIKLELINELYYDARPNKSQDNLYSCISLVEIIIEEIIPNIKQKERSDAFYGGHSQIPRYLKR